MNLIHDVWIPMRRKHGEETHIAPWEVTTRYSDDPVVALAAPRPDFNGALIQFLIGLLQTTCAPESPLVWSEWLRDPPSPEELHVKFEEIAYAFNLDGDGARFMQDLTLKLEDVKKSKRKKPKADEAIADEEGPLSIDKLLIDAPGQNTLEKNTDHFVKRGHVTQLCPYCAALALFTLQTNAPGGGQGHRAGLRSGGPLTTIILGATLWETAWLNVLERNKFLAQSGNPQKNKGEDKFPWFGITRTSEKGSKTEHTTSLDVHPAQNFWAMPRRIRLVSISDDKTNLCDLCGSKSNSVHRTYITKNYGVNYEGAWQHPLSPYSLDKSGQPRSRRPEPGGYRHWLGLVKDILGERKGIAPVILQYRILKGEDTRLWAFGYEMDKKLTMKARCWYDAEMPIIFTSEEMEAEYTDQVKVMTEVLQS